MACANDESVVEIIFIIGLFGCFFILSLLVLRMVIISAFSDIERAKNLIPRNIFLLGDLFAFKAALFVAYCPEVSSRLRFIGIFNAVIYVANIAVWILFLTIFLHHCA